MAHVSQKLSNSLEGALAGGGDPATSPLYVFGPFLRLVVIAGVAAVTFGTSVWLVVFTILMVSTMYRLVMSWVTDGSGGSGLSEEEFGGWAVKVNAAITFVEYTLTFLVSMAAMVTFISDRFPVLNTTVFGIQYRTIVAIFLSVLTGWLVNRGPKTAARAFGPATGGVLILLWVMVFSTIYQFGFSLPSFSLEAFTGDYLHFTFGGFTRMLAVMTGIEVFANLVAAYEGPPQERSRKAFGSLAIIMGTTVVTMLIVGPAIYQVSDPTLTEVSVFTQTMDALLPAPLPYLGTIISVLVLLSASAASAQGLQNLALGLRNRRYIPVVLGERNRYGVADKPVWLEVGLVALIFLIAGTNEETYLALYAAGVFILLSMTGWAAAKRLLRELKEVFVRSQLAMLIGIVIAALLTTAATLVIFEERFLEGAWMYFVFIPLLYAGFTYTRNRMGAPQPELERLGGLDQALLGGFGFGQSFEAIPVMATAMSSSNPRYDETMSSRPIYTPPTTSTPPRHILVPLDGSDFAEQSLPAARSLAEAFNARITLASVVPVQRLSENAPIPQWQHEQVERSRTKLSAYLETVAGGLREAGMTVDQEVLVGSVAESINRLADEKNIDIVVYSTRGRGGFQRWLLGSVASRLIQLLTKPLLIIRPQLGSPAPVPQFKKILVTLDGSEFAERVLPFARASVSYGSEIILLSVPQIPEAHQYGAVVEEIQQLREYVEQQSQTYLEDVAASLAESGLETRVIVKGTRPAETIVQVAEEEGADVVMLATHGRGGFDRLFVGSVADRVVQYATCPVFLVPIHERRANGNGQ